MDNSAYLDGWKAIAAYMNRSVRWCRAMGARSERPLPAHSFGGMVRLYLDDLDRWLSEERTAPLGASDQPSYAGSRPHRDVKIAGHPGDAYVTRPGSAPPQRKQLPQGSYPLDLSVSAETYDTLAAAADVANESVSVVADRLVNEWLDAEGAPR